ncbi:alpha/beta hydrolase [Geothermobacter hydrogeniphilus]|uniref:Alpha/beta hydrolase n=1 Tax=Geothermobacter hydrogeniphilus TaxID=1969733 RepID=A0A2K2HCM6_9BACT|nr:alpha/beta hydrolase [Geothermobacter hydrogeniphilus]PNU21040.1 alpha/beta hydrolase [Geothermobacter hydrogeniphilus]
MQQLQGFFNIDGVSLEYRLFQPRQATDPTLVFLHEGLGCVAMWKDFPLQVARLTGCRVLVYSRAGYGRSDSCPLPRPLSFMHDEGLRVLPKVLTAAEIERAVLVGHSDGASIALIHAGGLADPRLRGLILMAPHVFVEDLTLAGIRAAQAAWQTTDLREKLARYHGDNVDCAFLGWNRAWLDPDFADWNLENYLPAIDIPVLLIQGEQDDYGTIRQLEKIVTRLPQQAKMVMLPECGHSPFRDKPTEILQLIAEFLQQHFLSAAASPSQPDVLIY